MGAFSFIGDLVGGLLQKKAEKKATAQQQADLDSFTRLQGGEFDRRQTELGGATDRINALDDEGFHQLLAADQSAFDENSGITRDYSGRTRDAQLGGIKRQGQIADTRSAGVDSSFLRLGGVTEAERQAQAGYQAEANDLADALLNRVGFNGFEASRASSATGRRSLINAAITGGGNAAVLAKDPVFQRELALRVGEGADLGIGQAYGSADVSAYGDASQRSDQAIDRAVSDSGAVRASSQASFKALQPEIDAAQLEGKLAGEAADRRKEEAKLNTAAFVNLLGTEKDQTEKRVQERQEAARQSIAALYSGASDAEREFIDSIVSNSQSYEDAVRQLTNYKIGGTSGSSFTGKMIASLGHAVDSSVPVSKGGSGAG